MDIKEILSAVAKAFNDFKNSFEYGKTSDEMFDVFANSIRESIGEYQILVDYIWGNDTLNVDGFTKGYVAKKGDTLIMDVSVGKNGVWCDVTRSFFVGEVSAKQAETFELIKKSLREGQKALNSGAVASDVFNAVDSVYKKVGKRLIHHAGHRIGEKALLQPQFLAENNSPLEIGQYYAIESGLYEEFGLRLENNFLIMENGVEDLFEEMLPLNIEEYILK